MKNYFSKQMKEDDFHFEKKASWFFVPFNFFDNIFSQNVGTKFDSRHQQFGPKLNYISDKY